MKVHPVEVSVSIHVRVQYRNAHALLVLTAEHDSTDVVLTM